MSKLAQFLGSEFLMRNIKELGEALSSRRQALGLKQGDVAKLSGITQESLSRLERGRVAEFGSRKILAILEVLGLEISFEPLTINTHTPVVSEGSILNALSEKGAEQ